MNKKKLICLNKILYEKFFDPNFNWDDPELYKSSIIDDTFLKIFKHKINWNLFSCYANKLKTSIIIKYQNEINWKQFSSYSSLTSKELEILYCNKNIIDKLNWEAISIECQLTEDFIVKHKKEVNWHFIDEYQILSPQFKRKYKFALKIDNLYYKKNFFNRIKEKFNYYYEIFYLDFLIVKTKTK